MNRPHPDLSQPRSCPSREVWMPPLCRSHLIDREPYVRSAYADGWLWSWETRRQRPIETGPVLLAGPPPARRPTTPRGLAAGVGGLAVLLTCVRSARADRWRSDPRPQGGLAAGVGPCSPPAPPPGGRGLRDPGLSPVRSASPFRAARWRRSAEAGLPGSTAVLWPYMRVASATGWLLGPRPPGAGTSRVPTFPRSCSASPCRAAV